MCIHDPALNGIRGDAELGRRLMECVCGLEGNRLVVGSEPLVLLLL